VNSTILTGEPLYRKIRREFIGLDTEYTLATGATTRRIYLDSTATTLMMKAAHDVVEQFYGHYANTHSILHFGAKISTNEYAWAHDRIVSFLGADPENYTCFFTGSGTTAGINRLARIFRDIRPDKQVAAVSIMEHHSNDLPHRKHMKEVVHIPLKMSNGSPGCVCLDSLEAVLKERKGQINYVAMTGVSNVTGIINPINEAAEISHKYDALFLVDGAQLAAHIPLKMTIPENPLQNIDALVFSGHKTYVPGSPGVIVARKDLLSQIEPEEVGGGMVDDVFVDSYRIKDYFPDREEAGTPNIPGAIGLAAAIDILDRIGMTFLMQEEEALIATALAKMKTIPDLTIYGELDPDVCQRTASISFNIKGMDHGLVAAILNDYFNISVRNECFCAHPYVKEMIMDDLLEMVEDIEMEDIESVYHLKRGMVRASIAIYTTEEDVDALVEALKDITSRKDHYKSFYHVDKRDEYIHNSFQIDHTSQFSIENCIDQFIS